LPHPRVAIPRHVSSRRWLTGWRERQDAIAIILKAAKREGLSASRRCRRRDSNPRHADYDSAALTD
jgi:hypothetical protein